MVRPLQILRADGRWENIGGNEIADSFTKPESGSGFLLVRCNLTDTCINNR
ncbi:phage tail fiber C-terminal domain-containing protein [Escherichia coli]|uniref:phage tail fiber C-terminal domain-containing protein n=1 Tax=Escherichia coli TaxID=562 RepID=UPI00207AC37C|nr:phage tail fiber C-terminal domain-containing protein [Escherichia coli]